MQSELQKAADRVREVQEAITALEAIELNDAKAVEAAEQAVIQANLKHREALRDLLDTQSLLRAQREKRDRELAEMRNLSFDAEGSITKHAECRRIRY